ncbi:MAG TPA: peptidylprolyl isomerase, partial [Thermoanaerobaculia bacterium]|nr:peptidylprolyl isomerase [Thermoanaerobaculia bacterium]
NDKVIMHVNGEPVTESEFKAFMSAVPEPQQAMLGSPEGRRMLANEIVRMKVIEQEGRRLGLMNDAELTSQMDLIRMELTVRRALEKIVESKTEARIRSEYEKAKGEAKTLRHIVVGYEGSMVPPRGGQPLSAEAATQKAQGIVARLRGGADFAKTAQAESDDRESASRGGTLGPVGSLNLPPEMQAVIGNLQPGQVSDPVRSQFGIHIFSLGTPTLEDLRPMLMQRVQQEIAQEEVRRLEGQAKVDLDPSYFPPQQAAPIPGATPRGPRSNG